MESLKRTQFFAIRKYLVVIGVNTKKGTFQVFGTIRIKFDSGLPFFGSVRFILVSILLTQCCFAFAQQPVDHDTTGTAFAKKQLEKSKKNRQQFEAILTHFNGDHEAARDSLFRFRTAQNEQDAQKRIAAYKINTQLDTLKEIDLSHGRLTEIPDFVFQATSVERLILDNNDLNKLPGKLKKLRQLKKLDWSHILIAHTKAKLPKLKSLEYLDLSENAFYKIANLKKLKKLKTLDLSSNAFTKIPVKSLQRSAKLENLILDKNEQLKIVRMNYSAIPNLKVLKLGSCDLTAIDESLYGLTSLQELQLPENNLQNIPGGISNLKQLKTLSFYENELKTLPADFYNLKNLQIVDLYYNNLQILDTAVSLLKNLEVLYLSNNDIYDIPAQLGTLPKLRELYLAFNNLTAIPELKGLISLEVLRIDNNTLYEFPKDLLYLTELTYLDFSSNQITGIPPGLDTSYPKMQLLYFRENPIDFDTPQNHYIAPMIFEMSQRGVVCSPSFSLKEEGPQ